MNEIQPYIQMNLNAINHQDNVNDPDYNPDLPLLFDVFIAERELKIGFIVRWNDPDAVPAPPYEFEIVKIKPLHLAGIDKVGGVDHVTNDVEYPQNNGSTPTMGNADPTIVSTLFDDILNRYKITLNSVIMHSFSSFESNDFIMDAAILDAIKTKVNVACYQAMYSLLLKVPKSAINNVWYLDGTYNLDGSNRLL